MKRVMWIMVVLVAVAMVTQVTGCQRRRASGAGADGVSPVRGMPADQVYGQGLGPRFGMDSRQVEGQFQAVLFGFDSSQIVDTERAKLEDVARHMRRNPNARLIVEGHCDERGSREYNLSLGERRALAARAYLIGLGITGDRIQTRSYGSERPVAFGHHEEAWRQNRRAEFVIVQ